MGIIAISIGGLLLIVWVFRLMSRADRVNRQRAQRRREIWEAEGGTGPEPSDYIGRGGGS
jgi:hypothetical protein